MPSSYSESLRLELIGNGDQVGTWGNTTNTNLGSLLEQAITGVEYINTLDADVTLTNFNGVSDQARNAVIVITGPTTAMRTVNTPKVKKCYVIENATTGGNALLVKTSTGTGVVIPFGTTQAIFCDGYDFYPASSPYSGSVTGTGSTVLANSPTLTGTPLTPTAGTGTNTTQIASTAFVANTLASSPALGGTPTAATASAGTTTTQLATTQFVGTAVNNATSALGTMSTQNANNVNITGGNISGITDLAVSDGGTGRSSLTSNALVVGNGSGALNTVSPGSNGQVLTSSGGTWTPASPAAPTVLYNGAINANQTYSIGMSATSRPVQVTMDIGAIQGGNAGIVIRFYWNLGYVFSGSSYTPVNNGVNYVVYPCPSITTFVTPTSGTPLEIYIETQNLSVTAAWLSVIQL
jgi:hypothetical protein